MSKTTLLRPESISSEETAGEVVWSIGQYTRGTEVWKAFGLKGSPPPRRSASMPINRLRYTGRVGSAWMSFFLALTCCCY